MSVNRNQRTYHVLGDLLLLEHNRNEGHAETYSSSQTCMRLRRRATDLHCSHAAVLLAGRRVTHTCASYILLLQLSRLVSETSYDHPTPRPHTVIIAVQSLHLCACPCIFTVSLFKSALDLYATSAGTRRFVGWLQGAAPGAGNIVGKLNGVSLNREGSGRRVFCLGMKEPLRCDSDRCSHALRRVYCGWGAVDELVSALSICSQITMEVPAVSP